MIKRQRQILTAFAILDAVCLGRSINWVQWDWLWMDFSWFRVLYRAHFLLLVSLVFSAYGFAMERKWACWLSYAQFPARAICITLSFGWITLIAQALPWGSYSWLLWAAIALEVLRLAATIFIHRKMDCAAPKAP
jgi:hypothetical protein